MKTYNLKSASTKLLVVTMFALFGCSEEFLNIPPNHFLTDGNFYQTEADFDQAVIAVYANLQNYAQGAHFMEEGRSDNTTYDNLLHQGFLGGGGQYAFMDQFKMTSDAGMIGSSWSIIYDAIKDCNVTLSFLEGADLDPDFAAQVEGELKFFRAFFHFVAVRYWGNTPLLLTPVTSAEEAFAIKRNPIEEVYQAIIADAEYAATALPTSYSGGDIGRISKGAAQMLLAKVYLTRHEYAKAQGELNSIISSSQYSLLTDYASIFDPANKNHTESIFEVQFKEGSEGESSSFAYEFAPLNSRGVIVEAQGERGRNIPTLDMVDAYEASDLRKDVSVGYFDRNPSPLYYVKKYDNDSDPDFTRTPDNWPLYRYADVLLMLAEAINEQSYQTGTSFEMLNMVRIRAGLAALTSTDLPDQESFRNAVAQERRVELAFENHRWFDLVRTGKAIEVMTAFSIKERANPTLDFPDFAAYGPESFVITQDKLVYPIPTNELTVSPNLQPQNSGD